MPESTQRIPAEIIYTDSRYGTDWPKLGQATAGSAALDVRAAIPEAITLAPGECKLISTGVKIHLNNPNYAMLLLPRSGLGTKHGVVLGNLVGLIDSDYQGDIGIPVWNRNHGKAFTIEPGERISQLMVVPVYQLEFNEVTEFSAASGRGEGGFGSSGTK